MIKAEIVADSKNEFGNRITTMLVTMPRIILAEFNTHRMFSRNTASSRAISFEKMVKAIEQNPFIPIAWQKEHKGMQGTEYITNEVYIENCIHDWLHAKDNAIESATILNSGFSILDEENEDRVTKQLCNRLLEPFMWVTVLVTATEWENFFALRCPQYVSGYKLGSPEESDKRVFRSWNDLVKYHFHELKANRDVIDNLDNTSILDRLKVNKGQAEIHIMMLSEKIYDCIQESVPTQLKENEWHIPMISDLESLKLSTDDQIKLSVGRAANTSYTVVGDEKELTLEHAIKIHDKCKELNHSSVFEHCARAMSDEEYKVFIKGKNIGTIAPYLFDDTSKGWCNNLKGFIPYRYFIDNKIEI